MRRGAICRWVIGIFLLAMTGLFLEGCATMGEKPKPALVGTDRGTVVYEDKYEFKAPMGWKLLRAESGADFEFGFFEFEKGDFPSQTTFIYDPEPAFPAHSFPHLPYKCLKSLFFACYYYFFS